ncbi:winged helix-turn-helix transcriptional regulator [Micromonospora sp. NPDC047753]
MAQREYSTRPVRHEYLLTDKGRELCDLLLVIANSDLSPKSELPLRFTA